MEHGSQVLNSQQDALLAAGVLPEQIYQDCSSGKNDNRQGLMACLKAVRKGDTLIVWKLDRLGRNLKHLVDTVYMTYPVKALISKCYLGKAHTSIPLHHKEK